MTKEVGGEEILADRTLILQVEAIHFLPTEIYRYVANQHSWCWRAFPTFAPVRQTERVARESVFHAGSKAPENEC